MDTIGAPTRRAIFEAMVAMAWADARVEREEVLAMQAAGRVLDIPGDALDALDAGPPSLDALAAAGLDGRDSKLVFLCAAWLSSVDAREDEDEEALLDELAAALGIEDPERHRLRDDARLLRATTPPTMRWHEELETLIRKAAASLA